MICGKLPSPETMEKVRRSKQECEFLTKREVRCPHCGFLVDYVFSDVSGHREIKCRKCKRSTIMNMAYFRRVKRKTYPTYRRRMQPIR